MNFRRSNREVCWIPKIQVTLSFFVITLLSVCLNGCFEHVHLPSAEQLGEFAKAGPVYPAIDLDQFVGAKMGGGLYRVVSGDVLELTMPTILQVVMAKGLEAVENVSVYMCRVSDRGTITLPIVGEIEVAGKTLGQIESAIIDAYHPKYIGIRPCVLAQVAEYRTAKVSINGAVNGPGVYELRSDRMSLVALLMEAGGIVDEGAALIRIIHTDEARPGHENTGPNGRTSTSDLRSDSTSGEDLSKQSPETLKSENDLKTAKQAELGKPEKPEPIVLSVKGLNIPFADVALQDGDIVVVERLEMPLFAVIGLVNKPGNFPYPPDAQYNLMQAIAFAGGWDQAADPRYATIYRLKADGTIVRTPFQIIKGADGSELTDALNISVKPGDIVAIEHTPRTRTNLFLQRIFHVHVGAYVPVPLGR